MRPSFGIFMLTFFLVLAGCEEKKEVDTTTGIGSSAEPDQDIIRMKTISGRWRSKTGVLPGLDRKWITIDISNDSKVAMEVRSSGGKLDIVHGSATGDLKLGDESFNIDFTESSGDVKMVEEGRGRVSEGVMLLETEIGKVQLSYSGL